MNAGKILLSASMIAFVGAAAFTGTGAFFSDTETSTGNTFTAGEIDLTVDSVAHYNGLVCFNDEWVPEGAVLWNEDTEQLEAVGNTPDAISEFNSNNPEHFPQAGDECNGTWALTDLGPTNTFFNYGDLKPGDDGENTLSLHLDTNDGYVCAIISNLVDDDNGCTEPESEDGDTSCGDPGVGEGELSSELHFFAWADDGDNIWENGEQELFSNTEGSASDVIGGVSYPLFTPQTQAMSAGSTTYIGLYWCYGNITVGANTLSCDGSSSTNLTQTDSMTADISFYVEQARHNENFTCPDPNEFGGQEGRTLEVAEQDLALNADELATAPTSWLFYNDDNDTIMTIDQFAGNGGQNHMETVGGSQSAKMVLHDDVDARYNIATYQFKDIPLSSISSLTYRIYDGSVSAETPYLHFNVDFDNSDTWQRRLVQVPTGVVANTWTTVDAIDGGATLWTYSGTTWPAGIGEDGLTPGTTAKTWSEILTTYPSAETRSTDSFFGVRVGHPGPIGEVGAVDWIELNGVTYDFVN